MSTESILEQLRSWASSRKNSCDDELRAAAIAHKESKRHQKKEAKVFSRARPPVKHLMKKVAEVAGVSFKVTRDSDGWLVCELRGDVLAVVRVSLTGDSLIVISSFVTSTLANKARTGTDEWAYHSYSNPEGFFADVRYTLNLGNMIGTNADFPSDEFARIVWEFIMDTCDPEAQSTKYEGP